MTKTIHEHVNELDYTGKEIMATYLGSYRRMLAPDLIIAPDGNPYLFRWYLTPHNQQYGNVYFHLQVGDDPERPLHDHPWANASNILRGGYVERLQIVPPKGRVFEITRRPGEFIARDATEAHHLRLAPGVPYTMSIFSTGPRTRTWGFWYPDGWVSFDEVTKLRDDGKTSEHVRREHAPA